MPEDDLRAALARIEAKLDRSLEDIEDHEQRLRPLEALRSRAGGVVAAVGVVAGALGSYIPHLFQR